MDSSNTTSKQTSDVESVDMEELRAIPWVEQMLETLQDNLTRTVFKWSQIAMKLSNKKEDIDDWIRTFQEQFEYTCCELVTDMEHLQSDIIGKIEKSLTEIQQLCKTLQVDMPHFGYDKLSLYQEQHQLKKHIAEFEHIIEARRAEINNLRKRQQELCRSLGKEPKMIRENPLPSQNEIKDLQEYLDTLESQKFNRLETFTSVREEILSVVAELKYKPSTKFEKDVCEDDDNHMFHVTDENMELLYRFHKSLKAELNNVKEEVSYLRNAIDHYWNLLDIGMLEREMFRQKNVGNSLEVLEALRLELKRCEDLKKANIKELIALLDKHQKLWHKMIELEQNATGPNRYNNRGGQLLKEEKERNKLSKHIPKIEQELRELGDRFEARTGLSFLTFGQTVEEYIGNLHAERENARKQKLSARKQQRDHTVLTPAKSTLSVFPATSSQNLITTSKRKLALTPVPESQKKVRLTPKQPATVPKAATSKPIPKITVTTAGKSKRLSVERKKRIEKMRKRSLLKKRQSHSKDETLTSEYGEFQNELSTRVGCRSTLNSLTEQLPGTSAKLKTITPAKLLTPRTPLTGRTPKTPGTPTNGPKLTAAKTRQE